MLLLTRRIGESIVIDNEITITVVKARGAYIQVGINAPKNVSVNRKEIQDKINAKHRLSSWIQDKLQDRTFAKLYCIDERLFQRMLAGHPEAEFEVAKRLYQEKEFKLAHELFKISLEQGIRESKFYLEKIEQMQNIMRDIGE